MSRDAAVEFDGVSYTYPGGTGFAIERVSLRVEAGEMLAIVGPNGGGKSTLLKIILGLLDGYEGRATVFGRTPDDARRAGMIGYVPQRSGAELDFPVSAHQVALMGATARMSGLHATPQEARDTVEECLRRVDATAYADRPVGTLSGGQLQRIFIARALACRPKILALDEPLVGVDAAGQSRFGELLGELRRELGLTILLVSHDLRTIAGGARARVGGSPVCDRVACLRKTLHFHAAPEGITPQVLAEVFQHDLADIFGDVHVDAHKAEDCEAGHVHVHVSAAPKGDRHE